MNRNHLCALVLSLGTVTAQAAVQVYDWSYTGFRIEEGGSSGDYLAGQFTVDDANADGSFARSELLSFIIDGKDYAGCPPVTSGPCGFHDFSYAPGTGLYFRSHSSEVRDGLNSGLLMLGTDFPYRPFYPEGAPFITFSRWTEQTRFSISPVPEPQTYLMLGVGLLGMVGVSMWRRGRVTWEYKM